MKRTLGPLFLGAVLVLSAGVRAARADEPANNEKAGAEFDQFEGEFGPEKGKPAVKVKDPLIYYNRSMFWVNDKLYYGVFKPVALVYNFVLPEPVRVGIGNAYDNLGFPIRFVNSGLQGRFSNAGVELGRLLINSTLGVGGLWDPAERWFKIKKPTDRDFGQTFGKWGIGAGFPLVLPLLGPTNLRDGIGLIPNPFVDPLYYVLAPVPYLGVSAGGKFNTLSLHIGDYEKIKKDALDPYTFMRDASMQYREKKVKE